MKLLAFILLFYSVNSFGQRLQVQEGFFGDDPAEELTVEDVPDASEEEFGDDEEVDPSEEVEEALTDTEPEAEETSEEEEEVEEEEPQQAEVSDELEKADQITEQIPTKKNSIHNDNLDKYESIPLNGGRKKIRHPHAKKGLYLITKQREYIYKVKETPQDKAMTVFVGGYDPSSLNNGSSNFSDFYDSGFLISADYEWQVYRGALGVFGIKLASGLFLANGNGKLQDGRTSKEAFTFVMLPNSVSAVYRMKYWDNQPIIPYGEAGIGYYTFIETRDDDKGPWPGRIGGSPTAHWSAGGALDLSFLSRDSILNLDREYGINKVYLTVEFRQLIGLSDTFDFSGNIVNAGILAEF